MKINLRLMKGILQRTEHIHISTGVTVTEICLDCIFYMIHGIKP